MHLPASRRRQDLVNLCHHSVVDVDAVVVQLHVADRVLQVVVHRCAGAGDDEGLESHRGYFKVDVHVGRRQRKERPELVAVETAQHRRVQELVEQRRSLLRPELVARIARTASQWSDVASFHDGTRAQVPLHRVVLVHHVELDLVVVLNILDVQVAALIPADAVEKRGYAALRENAERRG